MLPNKKLSFSLLSCMVILSMTFSLVKAETVSASTNQPSQDNLKRVTNPSTGKLTFLSSDSTQPASAQALGVKPFSASIELLPSRASSKFDPAMSLIEHFGAEFGILNPAQELKVMRTDHPSGNRVVTHYQQMYKGLPVLAGELIVKMACRAAYNIPPSCALPHGLAWHTTSSRAASSSARRTVSSICRWI